MMNISNLSTKFIFSSILIFTILISMSLVSTASAQSDSETITGTLLQMHGSLPDGTHVTNYYIQTQNEDDTLEHSQISLDVVPSNIPALLGNKVIAEVPPQPARIASPGQPTPPLLVHGLKLVDDGIASQSISQFTSNFGTKNIVTLLVKFSDRPTTTHSQSYIQDKFYGPTSSMNEFYRTSSFGQMSLSGSATPWTTLPSPQATYFGDLYAVLDAALQANPQINWKTVDGVIIVANGCMESWCTAWGSVGSWNYYTPSGYATFAITWLPDLQEDEGWTEWTLGETYGAGISVSSHEIGHNVGFDHTTVPPGNWNGGASYSYSDNWSVMGSGGDNEGPGPVIMGQRNEAGWIPASNKAVVSRGSTDTITIDYANEPLNGSNTKMVTLPLPDGTSYILAANKEGVFSDTPQDNEGIVMHRFYPNGNNFPVHSEPYLKYVLVATSGTDNYNDFAIANLDVNETYSDAVNNVTVTVISKTATSVTAIISNGGITDTDGDGYADDVDACPTVAGVAPDGCPPVQVDTDGDGFTDDVDACPTVAGVAPNGCPADSDGDGFTDDVDACPTVAGVAPAGCPDDSFTTVTGKVFSDLNSNGIQEPGEQGIEGINLLIIDVVTLATNIATTDVEGLYLQSNVVGAVFLVQIESLPLGFTPSPGFDSFSYIDTSTTSVVDFPLTPPPIPSNPSTVLSFSSTTSVSLHSNTTTEGNSITLDFFEINATSNVTGEFASGCTHVANDGVVKVWSNGKKCV